MVKCITLEIKCVTCHVIRACNCQLTNFQALFIVIIIVFLHNKIIKSPFGRFQVREDI